MRKDTLRMWRRDGFSLHMYATSRSDWRGQTYIGYVFKDHGKVIFEGEDFAGSPLHADDSDATLAALLGFLSLRPGDTDREYFDKYTPAQMEWAESRAETLSYYQLELEEKANRR